MSVSAAKTGGDLSLVFPAGTNIETVPADLMLAINHSLRIIAWQENAQEEADVPPRWMWTLENELEAYFLNRKREKEAKYGVASSGSSSSDGDEDVDLEYTDNLYASRFK